MPAAASLDPRWLERFRNEVRAAARLHHANIVPFYELGRDDGSHFYTMQLIDGISLADVIRCLRQCCEGHQPCMNLESDSVHPAFFSLCERCQCRFACRDGTAQLDSGHGHTVDLKTSILYQRAAVEFVCDAAVAVDYAHQQGILHLDIKPSNLLIDEHGKLWIINFGAARCSNGAPRSDCLSGTLCYMSPEQAMGHDDQVDARSDVFSLGATLYELLTLKRPFFHNCPQALLTEIALGRLPPGRRANKSIAPELDGIIRKAMAWKREERYATALDFSNALEAHLNSPRKPSSTSRDKRPARRRRHAVPALFAAVAIGMVLVVARWRDSVCGPVFEWNGHYYALTEKETDWESAEAEAVKHGGHLITINNASEQAFVERTFLSPPDRVFWIGLTDAQKEGNWHWVSGEPIQYTNWENSGEPNNVTWRDFATGKTMDADYGVINWHYVVEPPFSRAYSWNDINSARDDYGIMPFRGIMEFDRDPR